jgi:hypothetical protein
MSAMRPIIVVGQPMMTAPLMIYSGLNASTFVLRREELFHISTLRAWGFDVPRWMAPPD